MSDKTKVLHLIKSLGRGGAEMLLPETLKYHDQEKYEFHYVYFLPWKDQMVGAIESSGGSVACLEASNNIKIMLQVPKLVAYIKQHHIQILHCHLPWAGIAGRLAAKIAGIPVVYTEHNNFSRYHGLTRLASRVTLHLNDLNIPVSADAEKALLQFTKPERIQLVLNGVDTRSFTRQTGKQHIRDTLNIPDDHVVIITAAVFREQKRLDNFVKVAERVAATHEKVSFIMIGDGPEKSKVEQLAAPLVAQKRLHFTGLQTDVKPYFNITDIYLMTSDFEGLPIALLEAMSMGCIPVTTGVGGIPEVIEHHVSGMISKAGDVESLEKDVTLLIENEPMRIAMAAEARKRIEQHFSMEKMVQKLEGIYLQYTNNGLHDKSGK
ncbi:glycosyltransferase [uncultured Pontibacter sp.]|uniref:glycosyltransferase n=1 Tax=uncultured Pontibacter sp. TaxID=453356 RepID=UPI0026399D28|nr:glycosyltransferase [uncultured Pontibacter sp.]